MVDSGGSSVVRPSEIVNVSSAPGSPHNTNRENKNSGEVLLSLFWLQTSLQEGVGREKFMVKYHHLASLMKGLATLPIVSSHSLLPCMPSLSHFSHHQLEAVNSLNTREMNGSVEMDWIVRGLDEPRTCLVHPKLVGRPHACATDYAIKRPNLTCGLLLQMTGKININGSHFVRDRKCVRKFAKTADHDICT